jgi:hypothetical protein
MPNSHVAQCPSCGHWFSAVDLAKIAQDGEVTRWLLVEGPDREPIAVRFGDFNPRTMKPIVTIA